MDLRKIARILRPVKLSLFFKEPREYYRPLAYQITSNEGKYGRKLDLNLTYTAIPYWEEAFSKYAAKGFSEEAVVELFIKEGQHVDKKCIIQWPFTRELRQPEPCWQVVERILPYLRDDRRVLWFEIRNALLALLPSVVSTTDDPDAASEIAKDLESILHFVSCVLAIKWSLGKGECAHSPDAENCVFPRSQARERALEDFTPGIMELIGKASLDPAQSPITLLMSGMEQVLGEHDPEAIAKVAWESTRKYEENVSKMVSSEHTSEIRNHVSGKMDEIFDLHFFTPFRKYYPESASFNSLSETLVGIYGPDWHKPVSLESIEEERARWEGQPIPEGVNNELNPDPMYVTPDGIVNLERLRAELVLSQIWSEYYGFGALLEALREVTVGIIERPLILRALAVELPPISLGYAFEAFYAIERKAREFVKNNLLSEYGQQWWVKGVPLVIRKKAVAVREDHSRVLSEVDCLYFIDLKRIIEGKDNWQRVFKAIFRKGFPKRNRNECLSFFQELNIIRNLTHHSARVTDEQLKRIVSLRKDIVSFFEENTPSEQTAEE